MSVIWDAATECGYKRWNLPGGTKAPNTTCVLQTDGQYEQQPTVLFFTTDTRIRRRTPQGLSLYSISKKKAKSCSAPLFVSPQQELQLALGDGKGGLYNPSYPLLSSGPVISRNTFCSLVPAISRHGNPPPAMSAQLMPDWRTFQQLHSPQRAWCWRKKKKRFILPPFAFTLNRACQ